MSCRHEKRDGDTHLLAPRKVVLLDKLELRFGELLLATIATVRAHLLTNTRPLAAHFIVVLVVVEG